MSNLVEQLRALRGDIARLDTRLSIGFQDDGSGNVDCPHAKGFDEPEKAVQLILLYERFGSLLPQVLPVTRPSYAEKVLCNSQPFNRAVSFTLFGPRVLAIQRTEEGACITEPVAMLAQAIDGLTISLSKLPTAVTVAQLAKVLDCSQDTVRRRARAEGWHYRTPSGKQRGMVFDVKQLPTEILSLLLGHQQAK